ncbi:unnamed protein product [Sphenostylis stenocarpa]|uniref:Uncharacterized protein n=1 Tax=Sphenostylis stenocarpa TaxID=92480 RepID=A0AA86SAE2_9FABA|nr:unnamed protein product [Sphenostylis stenocarpa]
MGFVEVSVVVDCGNVGGRSMIVLVLDMLVVEADGSSQMVVGCRVGEMGKAWFDDGGLTATMEALGEAE